MKAILSLPLVGTTDLAYLLKKHPLSRQKSHQIVGHGRQESSPREQTILHYLLEGKSNQMIARELHVVPETIKTHLKRLFQKLNISNKHQVVSKYYQDRIGPHKFM